MKQPQHISEILNRKEYQHLRSPNLKPTPDLSEAQKPMNPEEFENAKALYEYEQELEEQRGQQGYRFDGH